MTCSARQSNALERSSLASGSDVSNTGDHLLWIDAVAFVQQWLRKEAAAEEFILEMLCEGRIAYLLEYSVAEFDGRVSEGSLPLAFALVHRFFWKLDNLKIDRDRSSVTYSGPVVEVPDFDDDMNPRMLVLDPRRTMTIRAKRIRLHPGALARCLREDGFAVAEQPTPATSPTPPASPVRSSGGPSTEQQTPPSEDRQALRLQTIRKDLAKRPEVLAAVELIIARFPQDGWRTMKTGAVWKGCEETARGLERPVPSRPSFSRALKYLRQFPA
jgi:hypothetical protein